MDVQRAWQMEAFWNKGQQIKLASFALRWLAFRFPQLQQLVDFLVLIFLKTYWASNFKIYLTVDPDSLHSVIINESHHQVRPTCSKSRHYRDIQSYLSRSLSIFVQLISKYRQILNRDSRRLLYLMFCVLTLKKCDPVETNAIERRWVSSRFVQPYKSVGFLVLISDWGSSDSVEGADATCQRTDWCSVGRSADSYWRIWIEATSRSGQDPDVDWEVMNCTKALFLHILILFGPFYAFYTMHVSVQAG